MYKNTYNENLNLTLKCNNFDNQENDRKNEINNIKNN
jgi:glutathione peroxidase-family protein